MSEVRQTYSGGLPLYAVEYDDGGELREATFFDQAEAERFAAEQAPADQEDDSWVQGVLDAVADVPQRLAEAKRLGRHR